MDELDKVFRLCNGGCISKVQDGAGKTLAGLTILDRGYTGHEHLQSVALIHMDRRLYDPIVRIFSHNDCTEIFSVPTTIRRKRNPLGQFATSTYLHLKGKKESL